MRGLLVRVGADQTHDGGHWNGPVDSRTRRFVYVAIREKGRIRKGLKKPYRLLESPLAQLGMQLRPRLVNRHMHLDPDFDHLTYGDVRQRAKQIQDKVGQGDLLVFYAGLRNINDHRRLVYAIIGLYVIESIGLARDVPARDADINAHTRRCLKKKAKDIVIRGCKGKSGRLAQCLPIGEYRDRAYRVRNDILEQWGGLKVRNGYLQRSVRLPEFCDASKFYDWFRHQNTKLVQRNNL
jgi:hypothetical protein